MNTIGRSILPRCSAAWNRTARSTSTGFLLRFERGGYTVTLFADGRALVQGTTDVTLARSLYARFIGS